MVVNVLVNFYSHATLLYVLSVWNYVVFSNTKTRQIFFSRCNSFHQKINSFCLQ